MVQQKQTLPEITQYLKALDRVEAAMIQRRAYLEARVQKETISQRQLQYENNLLATVHEYIHRTEELIQTAARMRQATRPEQQKNRLNQLQAYNLEIENKKLRAWISSHRRNPDELLPWIKITDR